MRNTSARHRVSSASIKIKKSGQFRNSKQKGTMFNILHKISRKLAFKPSKKISVIIVVLIILALSLSYYFLIVPPIDFPLNSIYSIEENSSLSSVAIKAKKENLIKSPLFFKILTTLFSGSKGVISGDYVLNKKENLFEIVKRFTSADYRLVAIKITLPEGLNTYEIADILFEKNDLRNFNKQEFLAVAKDKEGYLYPDTYFFLPNVKTKQVIETMEENFMKKISLIQNDIKKFGKTFKEVLTMASIIEEEVRTAEDRKIVSGILWKRIKVGMPLQVDAVFPYITQKKNKITTRDNLKIDSPYNTYLNKGLPPGPIANPSLDAIIAAINPKETKYFYYISDKKGIIHYAKTLEDHNNNIWRHLR